MNSSARKRRAPVRWPYQFIWGFRCSRLTAFPSLLETASSIFISLLIHLFSLVVTIRHYSRLFAVFDRYSGFITGQRRQIGFPASVSRSRVSRRLLYIFFYHSCNCHWRLILTNSNNFKRERYTVRLKLQIKQRRKTITI